MKPYQQFLLRSVAARLSLIRAADTPGAALRINARPRPSARAAFQRYLEAEHTVGAQP